MKNQPATPYHAFFAQTATLTGKTTVCDNSTRKQQRAAGVLLPNTRGGLQNAPGGCKSATKHSFVKNQHECTENGLCAGCWSAPGGPKGGTWVDLAAFAPDARPGPRQAARWGIHRLCATGAVSLVWGLRGLVLLMLSVLLLLLGDVCAGTAPVLLCVLCVLCYVCVCV